MGIEELIVFERLQEKISAERDNPTLGAVFTLPEIELLLALVDECRKPKSILDVQGLLHKALMLLATNENVAGAEESLKNSEALAQVILNDIKTLRWQLSIKVR